MGKAVVKTVRVQVDIDVERVIAIAHDIGTLRGLVPEWNEFEAAKVCDKITKGLQDLVRSSVSSHVEDNGKGESGACKGSEVDSVFDSDSRGKFGSRFRL